MGGMYALKAAGLSHFRRVVAFYGMIRVPEAWKGSGHAEPLDKLENAMASPTLAIIGEHDPYTPPEDVAALEAARVTVVRYPDAEHGFVHDPIVRRIVPRTRRTPGSVRSPSSPADPRGAGQRDR